MILVEAAMELLSEMKLEWRLAVGSESELDSAWESLWQWASEMA